MSPRKRVVTKTEEELDDAAEEAGTEETGVRFVTDDPFTAIETALEGLPDTGTRIKFYKRNPETQKLEYDSFCALIDDLDYEEEARKRIGSGTAVLVFLYPRGYTDAQGRKSRSVQIELGAGHPVTEREKDAGPYWELREKLARQEGELAGLKVAMEHKPQAAPAMDPVTMMEKLSIVTKNLMPAPAASAPALDPVSTVDKVIGAVTKIVDVGRDLAPERGEGPNWDRVVDRGIDAVGQLLTEARAVRTGAAGAQANAPEQVAEQYGRAAQNVPVEIAAAAVNGPAWVQEIVAWMPRLIERARQGKIPENAVPIFLEDVSDATMQVLEGMAGQAGFVPGVLQQLATLVPETAQYPEWFRGFVEEVQATLTTPPDDEEGSTPSGNGGAPA